MLTFKIKRYKSWRIGDVTLHENNNGYIDLSDVTLHENNNGYIDLSSSYGNHTYDSDTLVTQ